MIEKIAALLQRTLQPHDNDAPTRPAAPQGSFERRNDGVSERRAGTTPNQRPDGIVERRENGVADRRKKPAVDPLGLQRLRAPADGTQSGPAAAAGLPAVLSDVVERLKHGVVEPLLTATVRSAPDTFVTKSYTNAAGTRTYKLFVPHGYAGNAVPLIVMLHGCTQSPDDFAAGTRMNALAEEYCFIVAYPVQSSSANAAKCWNWFNASDQKRDSGEPSLLAGITREIMHDYAIDPKRVYVAGLSAGAAAAAVLGAAYPDLYAAIGVHSGLPSGAAKNLPTALSAMRDGADAYAPAATSADGHAVRRVPTIVFHGDRDTTVHPSNGDAVIARNIFGALRATVHEGRVAGGRAYRRIVHADGSPRPLLEQWIVHDAGHAWSGGSAGASYTDPNGPDASREMVRFFMQHKLPDTVPSTASH